MGDIFVRYNFIFLVTYGNALSKVGEKVFRSTCFWFFNDGCFLYCWKIVGYFFGLAALPLLMIEFTMIPCQEYCRSEHYSIKEIKSGILGFPTVGLYQNNGLIEECLQKYDFVLSVKRMEEYDDLSAIIGYGCGNGSETFRTIIFR